MQSSAQAGPKQKSDKELMDEHYKDDPYKLLPGTERTISKEEQGGDQIEREIAAHKKATDQLIDNVRREMIAKGVNTSKQGKDVLNKIISQRTKEHDDFRREKQQLLTERRRQQFDIEKQERNENAPRQLTQEQLKQAYQDFGARAETLKGNANRPVRGKAGENGKPGDREYEAGQQRKKDVTNSILRYTKDPEDYKKINEIALNIMQQNKNMTADAAFDRALTLTSILPEGDGANLQRGKNATTFTARGNPRSEVTLTMPSGEKTRVDADTYRKVKALHSQNWGDWEAEGKKKAEDDKRKVGFGEALQTVAPMLLPPIGSSAVGRLSDGR